MSVYELAGRYYPELWGKDRLIALVGAGKLTENEYEKITGEDYRERIGTND